MGLTSSMVVIATRNQGKVKEFASLFQQLNKQVISLAEYPDFPEIEEDGTSFAENADKKAKTIAFRLGVPVLADDSGLCVDALDGAPGIFSARYSGEHANAERNNNKLISELHAVSDTRDVNGYLSTARFVCALTLVDPQTNQIFRVQGECTGIIVDKPRGSNGFGYDPLFYVPQFGKTMAELTMEEKNQISHRAKAMKLLLDSLKREIKN